MSRKLFLFPSSFCNWNNAFSKFLTATLKSPFIQLISPRFPKHAAIARLEGRYALLTPKTGLIGVYDNGQSYRVETTIGGTHNYLGTFKTKEEAGIAYDRFVVDKSTEKVAYVLNYPNRRLRYARRCCKNKLQVVALRKYRKLQSDGESG